MRRHKPSLAAMTYDTHKHKDYRSHSACKNEDVGRPKAQLTPDQEMSNVMDASHSCQMGLAMLQMQDETVVFVCLLHLAPLPLQAILAQPLSLEQTGH
jgi:hypothetical protein